MPRPVLLAVDDDPDVLMMAGSFLSEQGYRVVEAGNGAHALRLGESKGSIEAGKDADLAIYDVSDYREICYWFGSNHCETVIANGEVIET